METLKDSLPLAALDPALNEFKKVQLSGIAGSDPTELTRTPVLTAAEAPSRFGLDPEKVALGSLSAEIHLPFKHYHDQDAGDFRERARDAALYVFDEGPLTPAEGATGRHIDPDQPRYTIMGLDAVHQVGAGAMNDTSHGRHAAAPEGYQGRHRNEPNPGKLGRFMRRVTGRSGNPQNTLPVVPPMDESRYRAPVIQLGAGEEAKIGRHHWLPSEALDQIAGDPELTEHYSYVAPHQGTFKVDENEHLTYEDAAIVARGLDPDEHGIPNPSYLTYRELTPAERERKARAQQIKSDLREQYMARQESENPAEGAPRRPAALTGELTEPFGAVHLGDAYGNDLADIPQPAVPALAPEDYPTHASALAVPTRLDDTAGLQYVGSAR